ncbi:MAG TPA: CUAEP/CCAEP-tail radical SAM protein, partial [Polyangia bacterium]
MARVLLVSTYELGHQPLHLASPLGFLAAAGIEARAIDLAVEPLDEAAVRAATFVGVAVPMHTALRLGAEVGARVKALNPRAHLCYYGLYAPLNREHLLAHGADSIVGGEYEAALVELARGAGAAPDVSMDVSLERLRFVAPARARLPALEKYARLERDGVAELAGYVEASRGCLHHCRHCPIPPVYGGRFFVVPVDIVVADVSAQVAAGARHVTLGDPDFLNGPKHALAVARAIHAAHPTLTFDVTTKVEHILKHRDLFAELGALGCAFVVSAVESLSDRVLGILDKGHTRADVDEALAILDAARVPLRPTFVPFTPWTTLEDYLALVDWIEARGMIDHVDPIQLAIRLLIPPGSLLLDH